MARIVILFYILSFCQMAYAFDPFQRPEKKGPPRLPVPYVQQSVLPKSNKKLPERPKPHWEKPEDRDDMFQIVGKIKDRYIVTFGRGKQKTLFLWKEGEKKNNCIIRDWRVVCYEKKY